METEFLERSDFIGELDEAFARPPPDPTNEDEDESSVESESEEEVEESILPIDELAHPNILVPQGDPTIHDAVVEKPC